MRGWKVRKEVFNRKGGGGGREEWDVVHRTGEGTQAFNPLGGGVGGRGK